MARSETYKKWLEAGYNLFSLEGPEGIQVERLARILNLNKSGFYHYFGDLTNFFKHLIRYHEQKHDLFIYDLPTCQKFNPDFLNLILLHKQTLMAQMYMLRSKDNPIFGDAYKKQYNNTSKVIHDIWSSHVTIYHNRELSMQFFDMARDMFFSRVTWENLTFEYLLKISDEIYETATKILNEKERLQGQ